MLILGIETSCDETGVALYDSYRGLISNQLYSQVIHARYGGVVPELASRDHIKKIFPLIQKTFIESNIAMNCIDAIAYTAGPGLIGSLLVGATISHSLSYSLNKPVIPINHMEGHLLSPMLEHKNLNFPFIALLISGGHTQLIQAKDFEKYDLLGESIDDAVGEAIDKTAKLLGIQYPGGTYLEKMAKKGRKNKFIFTKPMINSSNMNFSFSGLKTSVAKVIKNNINNKKVYSDIALAFENCIIDILINKSYKALKLTNYKTLVIAGGVSANKSLRLQFYKKMNSKKIKVFFASSEFCTDNAAMIAYAGMLKFKKNKLNMPINKNLNIQVFPRWKLTEKY